ncbi:RNA ligase family protein [Alkalihalobacillus sp. AL-G]|uniref:ATP-dependent DNA ligase n=1 Tax=Alkalihalobacillus sp. AL-G TaxID=2926399 RepID=UPI00272C44B7|nr:RNA ligase family protein [Alkalihalobacillus sp. AL-G]WLD94518.1 DNA ligase [Alkalihalobacillus sp. AL-G]
MEPIVPMEPKIASEIPTTENWIAQVKWDGVHVLAYNDGSETRLFNRKKRERTFNYPELTDIQSFCSAESVILDGEIIALGEDGKPSFHKVMRRDGIRKFDRVKSLQQQVPISYMIFDVLFYNGEWMTKCPLEERLSLLTDIIVPNSHVQLVRSHDDGEALFDTVVDNGMEGIVMKRLDSRYYIGEKRDEWRKVKNIRDLIAVIGGFTLSGGIVNAVLIGLYDEKGNFIYIGHTGTGKLTASDWRELTERLQSIQVEQTPFVNKVDRHKDAMWVKPSVTAKIHFAEWTEGRFLRQPSIQAFVDVPAEKCVLTEDMKR